MYANRFLAQVLDHILTHVGRNDDHVEVLGIIIAGRIGLAPDTDLVAIHEDQDMEDPLGIALAGALEFVTAQGEIKQIVLTDNVFGPAVAFFDLAGFLHDILADPGSTALFRHILFTELRVDRALFAGDFRSYERTFSLITQVVGRGGRGSKPGRAILQTFLPEHYVLRLAAAQDYEGFAREEFSIRKALLFPPFCDICVVGFSAESLPEVQKGAACFVECMKEQLRLQQEKLPLRVLGPVPFTYNKIGGKYRYRLIIKCKNTQQFRAFLRDTMRSAGGCRELAKVHFYADMNGSIGV